MVQKAELIRSIQKLESALRRSKKNETAVFFQRMIVKIASEADTHKLKELLKQTCSSGAIAQYADFTSKEEQLFDSCFEEAQKLLSKL